MALLKKGDVNLGSDGDFQRPALLPVATKQTYAGIFSGWRTAIQKSGANEGKLRLWISVYTSFAKGISKYEKLSKPTEASFSVPITLSEARGVYTDFVLFLSAITGKIPAVILEVKASGEDVVIEWLNTTLNECIGTGLSFSASHNLHNGKWSNQIDRESVVADKKIEEQYRGKIKIDVDKHGVSFLAAPKPTYEDEVPATQSAPAIDPPRESEVAFDALLEEDEIPF